MSELIEPMFNTIVVLVEIIIILLLVDGIMTVIGSILGFSWKKVLMSAAAVFGILWLRDFIKAKKQKAREEIIQELKDDDFEIINK